MDQKWQNDANKIFDMIFMVELALKVCAMGLVIAKKSYLRDIWNTVDFIILIVSVIGDFSDSSNWVVNFCRNLRFLMPLRIVRHLANLKLRVSGFIQPLSGLANVLCLQMFCFALVTLLGMSLFMGK